jgi:hypothetical protein
MPSGAGADSSTSATHEVDAQPSVNSRRRPEEGR